MAPEQVRGDKLDKRSDVYGLGATLYCLLTGKPPHQGKDWEQIRDQVLNAEPVPPRKLNPAVDRNLEAITLKCLDKDPDKRYASAGALAEDLDRYLNDRPVLAKRPYFWERLYKWARREPIKAGLVAGIAFLLMTLFGCEYVNNIRLGMSLKNVQAERTTAENERQIAQQERDRARDKEEEAKKSAEEARQAKDRLAQEQRKHQEIATMLSMRAFSKFKQQESADEAIKELVKYIDLAKKNEPTDSIKLDLAESHRNLAQLYLQKGQRKEAAQQYKECTDLQEELSKKKEYQVILLELSLNLMELGTVYGQLLQLDPELNADLKALECLNKFEEQGKNNPVYLTALAEANTMLGIDYRKRGQRADSLSHQRKAIEILEELNRREKDNVTFGSFQKQLAKAYQEIGSTLSVKEPSEALTYLEKAKSIFNLRKTQYRRELAGVNKAMGSVLLTLNRHEDAFAPLREAIEIVNQLLDESPDKKQMEQYRLLKAQIFSVEASALHREGDTDKAKERFIESVRIREDLAAKNQEDFDPHFVDGLLDAVLFLVREKEYAEAEKYLDKAIPIQERLIVRHADVPNYLSHMGFLWFQKGLIRNRQKNNREALDHFTKAKNYDIKAYDLTKKKGEVFVGYLKQTYQNLFTVQMNLNMYKEAAETIEERVIYWPKDGQQYWQAAKDYADVFSGAKSDELAAKLVTFLDKGLNDKMLRFEAIETEPTMAEIRSHPEYMKLRMKYQP
jgi:tetratricopeptide (TPR) repeat protein